MPGRERLSTSSRKEPHKLTVVNKNKLRINNRDITVEDYLGLLMEEGYTCVIADFTNHTSMQTGENLGDDAVTILVMGEKRE